MKGGTHDEHKLLKANKQVETQQSINKLGAARRKKNTQKAAIKKDKKVKNADIHPSHIPALAIESTPGPVCCARERKKTPPPKIRKE